MHSEKIFPYKLMPKYPGMRPKDEVIWDYFIQTHPDAFEWVYYDWHLGDPAGSLEKKHEMQHNGAYDVSQWDVDVIAFDGKKIYVIEVKPNAGAGALGQALAYRKLLEHEGPFSEEMVSVVLTDELAPITETAAKLLGVIILVP